MNTPPSVLVNEEYIHAAPDSQLSSSNLLSTLLKEEEQYHHNQLSRPIQHILHQVRYIFLTTSFILYDQ
jgi:hypothetical protein